MNTFLNSPKLVKGGIVLVDPVTVCIRERPEEPIDDAIKLKAGRYVASDASYQADLRMDLKGTAIVSMDLFLSGGASRTFLASVCSKPGMKVKRGHSRIGVIAQNEDGNCATGTMELTPLSDFQATVSLVLDEGLYGLPVAFPLVLTATWQSPVFRTVGIEVDQEVGLAGSQSYEFEGRTVTVESSFYDAGIEIVAEGERDAIPKLATSWDESQLHGLMVQFADETLSRKNWTLHLLLLSQARMSGHLGIMFDTGVEDENGFPRQGAAVFSDLIQAHPVGFERKMLQTAVHELSHALNLAHRFERVVSRSDSTSFIIMIGDIWAVTAKLSFGGSLSFPSTLMRSDFSAMDHGRRLSQAAAGFTRSTTGQMAQAATHRTYPRSPLRAWI